MDVFFEIGVLVIFAGLGTYIARIARQPLVPAYIISGILVGKFFGIVTNQDLISGLSEFGIAFLLFMVGLEMEFKKLKDIGVVAFSAGLIQMASIFFIGYAAVKVLGFSSTEAVYLGLVVAFSSTMVVIKILSDKFETNTLHGRLIIGILVVQDIMAIGALSYLASMSQSSVGYLFFGRIALVIGLSILLSKFIFPKVFEFAARSRELLLTTSLSVCFLFALIFNSIGLSLTVGAFVAGIMLANLPYNIEIVGNVKSLRDFFAILFFTSLGLQLDTSGISTFIFPVFIISFLVTVAKPLVIYLILRMMGYKSRTSFLTASSLGQVSEFSLILVLLGVSSGAISQDILSMTIVLAISSMAFTSYFMIYEDIAYRQFKRLLSWIGIKHSVHKDDWKNEYHDAILCGYDRIGYSILNRLKGDERSVVVVDFNPDVIKGLKAKGIPCIYGDICDSEVFERLDFRHARIFISTATTFEDNLLTLQKVKSANKYVPAIVTARKIDEALELYKNGADYVILPHFLGGEMVSNMLPDFETSQLQMSMTKYKHIKDLLERKNHGHEHPVD